MRIRGEHIEYTNNGQASICIYCGCSLVFLGSYAWNLLPEELDSLTHFKYGNLKDQRSRSEAPHEEDAEFQDDNFKDYDGSKEEQG